MDEKYTISSIIWKVDASLTITPVENGRHSRHILQTSRYPSGRVGGARIQLRQDRVRKRAHGRQPRRPGHPGSPAFQINDEECGRYCALATGNGIDACSGSVKTWDDLPWSTRYLPICLGEYVFDALSIQYLHGPLA